MIGYSFHFDRASPERLETREGGGCVSLFGFPFLAAGIFLLLAGLKIIPFSNADEMPSWGYALLSVMSLAFTSVGGWLLFGRNWIIIDRAMDSIIKRSGWLVPMTAREWKLHEFNAVAISVQTDSESPDTYPVTLVPAIGGQSLQICTSTEFQKSYAAAIELAKFLSFPLKDNTTINEQVMTPENIDKPFRERMEKPSRVSATAFMPDMRTRFSEEGDMIKFVVPAERMPRLWFLPLVVPLLVLAFIGPRLWLFFRDTHTPDVVRNYFSGFAVFLFIVIPGMGILQAWFKALSSREELTVSSKEIVLEKIEGRRVARTAIAIDDIVSIDHITAVSRFDKVSSMAYDRAGNPEQMTYTPPDPRLEKFINWLRPFTKSEGIVIKTRSGLHTFGVGLSDQEVINIYARIVDKIKKTQGGN